MYLHATIDGRSIGLPASGGLPVGMQIIGKRYADSAVLAASAAFERVRPWQDTYRAIEAVAY